jgi:hypothetical protein
MRRARRTASEITAVCDLVRARLSLGSYHSLPGGTVEEASGARRTAPEIPRKSTPIFSVSPLGSRKAPAAGGRASGAYFGTVRIQPLSVARRGSPWLCGHRVWCQCVRRADRTA